MLRNFFFPIAHTLALKLCLIKVYQHAFVTAVVLTAGYGVGAGIHITALAENEH
tara:strand:- start:26033 stop:26194 length:162 start_codon:yes stop_codon:yes gene_type:complete